MQNHITGLAQKIIIDLLGRDREITIKFLPERRKNPIAQSLLQFSAVFSVRKVVKKTDLEPEQLVVGCQRRQIERVFRKQIRRRSPKDIRQFLQAFILLFKAPSEC